MADDNGFDIKLSEEENMNNGSTGASRSSGSENVGGSSIEEAVEKKRRGGREAQEESVSTEDLDLDEEDVNLPTGERSNEERMEALSENPVDDAMVEEITQEAEQTIVQEYAQALTDDEENTFRDLAKLVRSRTAHLSGSLVGDDEIDPAFALGIDQSDDEEDSGDKGTLPGVPEDEEVTLLDPSHDFWSDYERAVNTESTATKHIEYALELLIERGHIRTSKLDDKGVFYVEVAGNEVPIHAEL